VVRRWLPAHDRTLVQLAATATAWNDVAAAMADMRPGLTGDAARVRAAKLGVILGVRELWTAEQDAALRALVGRSWAEVARAIQPQRPGATEQAVSERARVLGLRDRERPWTAEQKAMLERLVLAGLRTPDMVAPMREVRPRVTRTAIANQMAAMGLESVAGPGSAPQHCRRTIGELTDQGMHPRAIAALLGMHVTTAHKVAAMVRR